MNLIILVGPPGAGKSTYAKQLQQEGYIRISQDDSGKAGHILMFNTALSLGHNIVIDRLNFSKEQRARYITAAKVRGYEIKIITLFVPYQICLDRCNRREDHPTIKDEQNAKSALQTFFTKFERPTEDEGVCEFIYYDEIEKRKGFIIDLDGTMCNIDHRLHYVRREGKKDWKSFFNNIQDDSPNIWCTEIIKGLQQIGYIPIFCSGRPDSYRDVTDTWIQNQGFSTADLYMRHRNDHRSDEIAKEIILDFELLTRYDILMAIDDRQRVVNLWRRRDIVALQCSKGNF